MNSHHRSTARRVVAAVSAGLLALGLAALTPGVARAAGPAPVGQGFTITPSDLAFILKQIKISEHHAATLTPSNPCGTLVGPGPDQIPDRLSPFGLRTVDGSCNNLFPGRETFGATDLTFPRLTTPSFRSAEASPPGFFGPGGPDVPFSSYTQKRGLVFDSQPRLISNLIVDQTSTNPAAVAAAGFPVRAQPDAPRYVPCTTDPDPLAAPPVEGVPAGCIPSHKTLPIPNISTDNGFSPPYNSLFTFFGQFFDHGVDQTVKGGSGTVFVPLKADDPLRVLGPDGQANTGDEVPASQAFMVLNRATNQPGPDGVLGTDDDVQNADNTNSPWVDQSQTYTSHASHQVFLREYVDNAAGVPVSTGRLLGGLDAGQTYPGSPDGRTGLSTWAAVKQQAADLLGLRLVDANVGNVPMLATDPYGRFLAGPHGLPQYVTKGPDGRAGTSDDVLVEGDLVDPVPVPADVVSFDTPFLTDIAHNADPSPQDTNGDGQPDVTPTPDADNTPSADFAHQPPGTYDDEMLDSHFACGDGRCNENIALSAVHQVFHSEHDRLVAQIEDVLTHDTSGATSLSDWQLPNGAGAGPDSWNGERIFQAARFINEMEYQHLVFGEFARKVAPAIPAFDGYSPDVNPAIHAEFAAAVYRFGHSMLDEDVARKTEINGAVTNDSIPLLTAFLNPPQYFASKTGTLTPEQAAGSVIMGSSDQPGNEIDEFVTETLRNNLLGLPLDLAAINMTRARDVGIPPLNSVRSQLADLTNDPAVAPYESWADFGQHLKHPESLVNFVAAYGKHPTIVSATTAAGKRAAARAIVDPQPGDVPPDDAADFLFGTCSFGPGPKCWDLSGNGTNTGLEDVDLWVGGLAEATPVNGGLLGTTFNDVFENQLTDLQNGDRLYYLNRTPGMNLGSQLEGNSFAEMIGRNTEGTHSLKAEVFSTADCRFELADLEGTPQGFVDHGPTVADDPATTDCNETKLLLREPDGTIAYRATNTVDPSGVNGQAVYNGTPGVDRVAGGTDSDTFWGGPGGDVMDGNHGDDVVLAGEGNDVVTDSDGIDIIEGGPGEDALDGGPGLDHVLGGDGNDLINGGAGGNLNFGGPGVDFINSGSGTDISQGDSEDDWIQGGAGTDVLIGDHGAPFFDDPGQVSPGNDVLVGQAGANAYDAEGGDDVMASSPAVDEFGGFAGYDWATHQYDTTGADDDMNINRIQGVDHPTDVNRDSWQETEAVSGSSFDDVIRGDDAVPRTLGSPAFTGCDVIDQAGIDRIAGLGALLPPPATPSGPVADASRAGFCPLTGPVWGDGNILLGGGGSDVLEGRGGDDVIDGDRALTVRISVRSDAGDPGTEIGSTDLMEHPATSGTFGAGTQGMTLQQAVFSGLVDPAHLVIVREIKDQDPANQAVDTAVFSDLRANYDCIVGNAAPAPCDLTSTGVETKVLHVRGNGVDGTDTIRNVERLQFGDVVAPTAPIAVTAVAGDAQATVTWTAPAGPVDAYTIQVVKNGTFDSEVKVGAQPTRLVVSHLTNGARYAFQVMATNSAGDSPFSAVSNEVTPQPFVPAPVDPVLTSTLTKPLVLAGRPAAVTGTVTPFQGVTVTLSRDVAGKFQDVASTTIDPSATSGSFRFPLSTKTSGFREYRVTVSGTSINTTSGPALGLSVFRAEVVAVSPRGREFVTLENTGKVPTQIGGWRLRDRVGKVLVLPELTLAVGASVKVYSGTGHSTPHALFLGRRGDVWHPRHDTASLYDAHGTRIDTLRY